MVNAMQFFKLKTMLLYFKISKFYCEKNIKFYGDLFL